MLTITQDVINVVAGNPGLTLNDNQVQALLDGRLGFSTPVLRPKGRCIKSLRYQTGDHDLVYISFDDGTSYTTNDLKNLNEFRERLQEAANFGHGVTFCIVDGQMVMLNIFPCGCDCEDK